MSFMQMQITQKGRLASCDCAKCGATNYWHEWVHDDQAEDLKQSRCNECGSALDADTYWESPNRDWYAGRYSAPGYMDCTDWSYSKNKRALQKELREMYGD